MKKITIHIVIMLILLINISLIYAQNSGTFVDSRDGEKYRWVKIGNQIWMAQNLNYNAKGSQCWASKYGRLYDYNSAIISCPNGWHLPSSNEWEILEGYMGLSYNADINERWFGEWAGAYKLRSDYGWDGGIKGSDLYGFCVLPGGKYISNSKSYEGFGEEANFWTSTKSGKNDVWIRYFNDNFPGILLDTQSINNLMSVRCIKNK